MEELRKYVSRLLQRVEGLLAIVITDRDGVHLVKAIKEQVPEMALRPSYLSTFAMAADQAGKLGVAKNNKIISIYSNYQVVQINKNPLVISLIATKSANTGQLINLENDLSVVVDDLAQVVVET